MYLDWETAVIYQQILIFAFYVNSNSKKLILNKGMGGGVCENKGLLPDCFKEL